VRLWWANSAPSPLLFGAQLDPAPTIPAQEAAIEHDLTLSSWTIEVPSTYRFSVGAASQEEAEALANKLVYGAGDIAFSGHITDGDFVPNEDADLTITLQQSVQSDIPISDKDRFESRFPSAPQPSIQSDILKPSPFSS
jgi:hypothetical protein